MRAFAFAWALSLALAGAAEAAPRRVVSLNLCSDELVLMLAAPGQIASVTHLSQDPEESPLWRQARHYPRNDGSLLSAARLRPDLLITMGGAIRDRAHIAARLGIPMLVLPFPDGLGDVAASIRRVAAALGRPARGGALARRIEGLERSRPRAMIDTIFLNGGGRTVRPSGLAAQWMALAGFRQRAVSGDKVTLEQLLLSPPAMLLRSDYRSEQYSGEQRWLSHPLARRVRRARTIWTDGRRWTCMGPLLVDEIARLRGEATR